MSNDYQSFLQQRHAQFVTPDEVIEKAVLKATGKSIKKKTRIIEGENNEVHEVILSDHTPVIVRINYTHATALKREEWAIKECLKVGVPVPTLLLSESIQSGKQHFAFSIQSKIPGVLMKKIIKDAEEEEKKELTKKAGVVFSQIHTVTTSGFGELNEDGQGEYKNFSDRLQQLYESTWYIQELAQKHDILLETIEKTYEYIKKYEKLVTDTESKLLHSDYRPAHIFFENNEISGVIDFEVARAGDPVQDISTWDYYFWDRLPLEWIIEGYTNKALFDKDFDIKLNVYKLISCIELLYTHDKIGSMSGLDFDKKNFARSLEFFKKL